MKKRIDLTVSCFAPTVQLEINVPEDCDPEEYIDEFLDAILKDPLSYNAEWDFC